MIKKNIYFEINDGGRKLTISCSKDAYEKMTKLGINPLDEMFCCLREKEFELETELESKRRENSMLMDKLARDNNNE